MSLKLLDTIVLPTAAFSTHTTGQPIQILDLFKYQYLIQKVVMKFEQPSVVDGNQTDVSGRYFDDADGTTNINAFGLTRFNASGISLGVTNLTTKAVEYFWMGICNTTLAQNYLPEFPGVILDHNRSTSTFKATFFLFG